jgi:hypothetical protein
MRKYGDKEVCEAQIAYNRYVVLVVSITDAASELIRGFVLAKVADRDGVQEVKVII